MIITISRAYAAGGSEVAAMVANSLGWSLLDNDLVERVATRMRTTPATVQAIEERVPSLGQRLAEMLTLGSPESVPPSAASFAPTEERLLEQTQRVIDDAVKRGSVVIVGRGAQAMLGERRDTMHVFCYAPQPDLVARAQQRHGCSAADAERIVDEKNRQREQYVRRHWDRPWQDPAYYHLCVNTDALGLGGAARLIAQVAREGMEREALVAEERRRP